MKIRLTYAMFAIALTAAQLSAATLVHYTFDTNGDGSGSNTLNAFTAAPDLTASAFTHSIENSPTFNVVHGGPSGTPSLAVGEGTTNWTSNSSLDLGKYFTFTVTTDPGYFTDLTELTFYSNRNADGPVSWTVRSSLDGFTTDLATGSNGPGADADMTTTLRTAPLGLSKVSGPVEFRIYGYNSAASTNGAFRIDDVLLSGTAPTTNLLINGDFETNVDGDPAVPDAWTYGAGGDNTGSTISVDTGSTGPGESAFTAGNQSVRLTDVDNDADGGQQFLRQNFADQSGKLEFSFDFYIDDDNPNNEQWNAQLRDGATIAFAYNIDYSSAEPFGQFTFRANGAGEDTIVLDTQTWYRIVTLVDVASNTFQGLVYDINGLVGTLDMLSFQNAAASLNNVRFIDGATSNNNSTVNFDNVSLSLVPTPAALPAGLVLLGALATRRRR